MRLRVSTDETGEQSSGNCNFDKNHRIPNRISCNVTRENASIKSYEHYSM